MLKESMYQHIHLMDIPIYTNAYDHATVEGFDV